MTRTRRRRAGSVGAHARGTDCRTPARVSAAGPRRADRTPGPGTGRRRARPARGPGRGRAAPGPDLRAAPAGPHRPPPRGPTGSPPWRCPAGPGAPAAPAAGWPGSGPAGCGWPTRPTAGRRGPAGPRRGRHRSPYARTTPPPTTSASCCRPASGAAPPSPAAARTPRSYAAAAAALATRYVPSVGGDPLLGRPGRPGHRQHRQPDEPRAAVPGGRPRGTGAVARPRGAARADQRPVAGPPRRQHVPRRPARRADRPAGLARDGAGRRPTTRPGPAGTRGRCTASPRRTASRTTSGCSTRRAGPPASRWRTHRATACRGGTTTRRAPDGTRRRRRSSRPACSSWPGSTPTRTCGRGGGPPGCTPCGRWSGRATWPAAPAPGRCCCTAATTRRTTRAA